MSDFRVDDERLVRYDKRYTCEGGVAYVGETTVITKEEFVACYDAWIKGYENEKES